MAEKSKKGGEEKKEKIFKKLSRNIPFFSRRIFEEKRYFTEIRD